MEFNYMEGLLLSDLLCLFNSTADNKYIEEIKKRMFFCGFTIVEITEFINFENNILNSKKEKYNVSIINNYFLIGKKKKQCYFSHPENYMFNPESNNENTLMISELISIIDEAIFLTYSTVLDTYYAKEEIKYLSLEEPTNWLFFEFKNRIEYICRCANHIINGPKSVLYGNKTDMLYDNEMQVCLKRWKNIDVSSRNFIPYTYQYFD